jgi:hypothetical protein
MLIIKIPQITMAAALAEKPEKNYRCIHWVAHIAIDPATDELCALLGYGINTE